MKQISRTFVVSKSVGRVANAWRLVNSEYPKSIFWVTRILRNRLYDDLGTMLLHDVNYYFVVTKEEGGIKPCSRCKVVKRFEDFYKDKSNATGFGSQCKDCHNEYLRTWSKGAKGKKYHQQAQLAYSQNNPLKVKAHQIARQLRTSIKKRACEECGLTGKLHMHHPDYMQPALVMTLCIPCHERIHHGS